MTQNMADTIGTMAGDPGCKMMIESLSRKARAAALIACVDLGYVVAGKSTAMGIAEWKAAVTAGEVRM